jgi:hypothetical protein
MEDKPMIVKFKSGGQIKISQVIAKRIYDNLCTGNAAQFQLFKEESTDAVLLCINIQEVESIILSENII